MSETILPASTGELLDHIRRERTALEATLARLTPAQMMTPGPDGWTVKDHLNHIVVWQGVLLVKHLQGRSFAEATGMDQATSDATEHMTAETGLNDFFLARDRARPLDEVLADFRRIYDQVVAALAALDYAALSSELRAPCVHNTYEHDAEHHRQIQALVGA
jgi:hypothetical protein